MENWLVYMRRHDEYLTWHHPSTGGRGLSVFWTRADALMSVAMAPLPPGFEFDEEDFGPGRPRWWSGAQRLSASQRSAHPAGVVLLAVGPVLNAFRHHRGRHDHDVRDLRGRQVVLNAFRHHRGRHRGDIEGCSFQFTCSTPFGITEVGTAMLETLRSNPH